MLFSTGEHGEDFNCMSSKKIKKKLKKWNEDLELLKHRKNALFKKETYFIIDEPHRSQSGVPTIIAYHREVPNCAQNNSKNIVPTF
jgi:hypothetical protein